MLIVKCTGIYLGKYNSNDLYKVSESEQSALNKEFIIWCQNSLEIMLGEKKYPKRCLKFKLWEPFKNVFIAHWQSKEWLSVP